MASNWLFPMMTVSDIVSFMKEIFPDDQFTEKYFKEPQANHIQQIYQILMEVTIEVSADRFSQPQLEASRDLAFPELHDEICPVINLSIAMSRFMTACRVTDFKIKDLLEPKPKRTVRMLSAIINFYRFSHDRYDSYNRMKQQQAEELQQHRSYANRIDELKSRINQIKAARAMKDAAVAEMAERVEKLSSALVECEQEQGALQRDIQQIKTGMAEKAARIDHGKVRSHNTKGAIEKLRPQIIQSPERIKTDMTRMHNAIGADKETKEEKAKRLQEIRTQKDKGLGLLEASQQGVKMLHNITSELDKQREVTQEIEKIRDKCQMQNDALREIMAKEGHINRQINNRQEKLSKLALQHKLEVETLKENIADRERELAVYEKKEQQKCVEMQTVKDEIDMINQHMADKENEHYTEMEMLKETYHNMMKQLDDYHADIAVTWEQCDPRTILGL